MTDYLIADEGNRLAGEDRKRDIAHRADFAALGVEGNAEVFQFQ